MGVSGCVARWHGWLCSLMTGIRAWEMDFGPLGISVDVSKTTHRVSIYLFFCRKIPYNAQNKVTGAFMISIIIMFSGKHVDKEKSIKFYPNRDILNNNTLYTKAEHI